MKADHWFQHTYWKMYDDLQIAEDRRTVRAVKVVTWNEPLLRTDGQGHVVLPSLFVVEGFLQMVAMMLRSTEGESVRAAMLLKVKSAVFHRSRGWAIGCATKPVCRRAAVRCWSSTPWPASTTARGLPKRSCSRRWS